METFIRIFSLKGRANRTEFWIIMSIILAVGLIPAFLVFEPYSDDAEQYVFIVSLITAWPYCAVLVRRWHDRNKSGWWGLIILIPLFGYIWAFIETGFLPSVSDVDTDHTLPLQLEEK